MIRLTVNRGIDDSRMFGVWRVDPPWKPITKKGQGHRMGGGKGAIDHYVTPVKAGRIIIEIGGHCDFEEVEKILTTIKKKMPMKCKVISQIILDEMAEEEDYIMKNNMNPFTVEWAVKNNLHGIRKYLSFYDDIWHLKHR